LVQTVRDRCRRAKYLHLRPLGLHPGFHLQALSLALALALFDLLLSLFVLIVHAVDFFIKGPVYLKMPRKSRTVAAGDGITI
jgi:hypothetical protein